MRLHVGSRRTRLSIYIFSEGSPSVRKGVSFESELSQ